MSKLCIVGTKHSVTVARAKGNSANFGFSELMLHVAKTEQHTADSLTVLKFPESKLIEKILPTLR